MHQTQGLDVKAQGPIIGVKRPKPIPILTTSAKNPNPKIKIPK